MAHGVSNTEERWLEDYLINSISNLPWEISRAALSINQDLARVMEKSENDFAAMPQIEIWKAQKASLEMALGWVTRCICAP